MPTACKALLGTCPSCLFSSLPGTPDISRIHSMHLENALGCEWNEEYDILPCASSFPSTGNLARPFSSPPRYTNSIPSSVEVHSFTFSNSPIFLTIGTAELRRSTACPPSRRLGARSTMVMWHDGRNLCSQKARQGPVMPAPEMRMLRGGGVVMLVCVCW